MNKTNDEIDLINKTSKLTKGQIAAVLATAILIASIVLCSFFFSKEQFVITSPIVLLLIFLMILALSNSFDNFSVGKILSISRSAKESKERVKTLEKERNDILLKLINLNIQSQTSSTNNYFGNLGTSNGVSIAEANEQEKEELKDKEEINSDSQEKITFRNVDLEKLRTLLLIKYFGQAKNESILRDIKFIDYLQNSDPISNKSVIFNAYLKSGEQELFIDIKHRLFTASLFTDQLYVKINKILNYRNAKKNDACLLILIPRVNDKIDEALGTLERLFLPAQKNNLLTIKCVNISEDEYNSCLKND